MGHTEKTGSHLEIWVTIGKMGHIWENESHFIYMGHTYQNCRTWKYTAGIYPDFSILIFLKK